MTEGIILLDLQLLGVYTEMRDRSSLPHFSVFSISSLYLVPGVL